MKSALIKSLGRRRNLSTLTAFSKQQAGETGRFFFKYYKITLVIHIY